MSSEAMFDEAMIPTVYKFTIPGQSEEQGSTHLHPKEQVLLIKYGKKRCTENCSCRKARLFCSVLCLHCWDNCNNRKIQVINSDKDDEPMLPNHLVEASLSFHVEEDTDYLPKDIRP
ncbi:hypothetical protein AVEN_72422-1 [Araneus ventricosus]|uniref:Uncharacterized protein n=1 Tax=Araneus ventricosus TaxID=182803 RepID=A0A4Y2P4P6_ARAVE|nr:hypothetical protein AVEN_72422-1 [Araneus ventricosus]